ncbi:MAG: darcynin family protein [Candidatus Sericytochromatia bacterium]
MEKAKYTILILLSTTEKWLRLSRQERKDFFEKNINKVIEKYKDDLKLKLFDSEAFNSKYTDFIIIETENLTKYYFFWEEIRDSKIYTEPYFVINEIILGMEDGYKTYENSVS